MLNLCIIFGGKSSEHEVSIMSARSIYNNVNRDKYRLHMIKIEKDGSWNYFGEEFDGIGEKISIGDLEKFNIDVIFPVLHGKLGEDGTIQGLFEIMGIPYVGSGVLGSAACMDKDIAKILIERAGVPTVSGMTIRKCDDISEIIKTAKFPCFVKPANAGSSVGVSKALNVEELCTGVAAAFEHDDKVLVENAIDAREIECSVMGNENPVAAEVLGEILPANEFYDYEAKYQDVGSKEIIPADLPEEIATRIREYAVEAYKMCCCHGLARVDFFVDRKSGKIYLNEINTMPGFTDISMYPKLWDAAGLGFSELIDRLIELALE